MKTIYIEQAVADHPTTQRILQHFGQSVEPIYCDRYGEIFNQRAQHFRLQKQAPALILAQKPKNRVLPAPEGFGIGSQKNYYFSHMLNCLYDCRYCFLQGMYQSANYVLFVNYDDFMADIAAVAKNQSNVTFFSGYDCDSLAYEPVSHFLQTFLPFFAAHPAATFELRTKSTNIKPLLKHAALANVVTAFSFTPDAISQAVEYKVPSVEKRIRVLKQVADADWPVGLRFDPLIWWKDFEAHYGELFKAIFNAVDPSKIHSASVGPLRFPAKMYQNLVKLYPDDKLLAHPLHKRHNHFSYSEEKERQMKQFVTDALQRYLPKTHLFSCSPL